MLPWSRHGESGRCTSLQGQVGWLSRSQIAASRRVRGKCPCSRVEAYIALYISLLSILYATMRSQRLLRVREGLRTHVASFANHNRLPRRKAYVLSVHVVWLVDSLLLFQEQPELCNKELSPRLNHYTKTETQRTHQYGLATIPPRPCRPRNRERRQHYVPVAWKQSAR